MTSYHGTSVNVIPDTNGRQWLRTAATVQSPTRRFRYAQYLRVVLVVPVLPFLSRHSSTGRGWTLVMPVLPFLYRQSSTGRGWTLVAGPSLGLQAPLTRRFRYAQYLRVMLLVPVLSCMLAGTMMCTGRPLLGPGSIAELAPSC